MADIAGAAAAPARRKIRLDARAIAGGIIIALLFLTALLAPLLAPHNPLDQDLLVDAAAARVGARAATRPFSSAPTASGATSFRASSTPRASL